VPATGLGAGSGTDLRPGSAGDVFPHSPRRGPILVTGAAGFAGGHLLDLLSADGAELIAWHRPGAAPPRHVPGTRWDAIDLLDRDGVVDGIRRARPDAVYHCAGAAHVGRAWDSTSPTFAANVLGTHYLLEALRTAQLRVPVLIPSSALVYRPAPEALTEEHPLLPSGPYGVSKLAQELLAMRAAGDGIEVRVARAFNHVGPRQHPSFAASGFARQIAEIEAGRHEPEIVVGNLKARREVTDVRDTVRAYRLLVERGQTARPYNVCSGHALAIGDVLDRLVARARVPVRARVDEALFRPHDVPLVEGDARRIREELGWVPAIPLERTLDEMLEYWRSTMP
jgi:GDP-4-dehydro-6-deoxy-D-mannose reductase